VKKAEEQKQKLAAEVLKRDYNAEKAAKDAKLDKSDHYSELEVEEQREKYFSDLAKPKDKWKVGRKLLEL
jgi:hypothetical protein